MQGGDCPPVFSGFHPFYPQNRDLQGRFQGFAPPCFLKLKVSPPCFLELPTAL